MNKANTTVQVPTSGTVEGEPYSRALIAQFSGPGEAFGQAIWLMMKSDEHKHLTLAEMEWRVAPAIQHGQFMILKHDKVPVAYASWALLNEEADQHRRAGETKLSAADWALGDYAWVVDIVAPFGGHESVFKSVQEKFFSGRELHGGLET